VIFVNTTIAIPESLRKFAKERKISISGEVIRILQEKQGGNAHAD
jgi:hypothetical protein